MNITNPPRKGEETALGAFQWACIRLDAAASDGMWCDDLEAAAEVLRALEEAMAEAQAAIRRKESRRSL